MNKNLILIILTLAIVLGISGFFILNSNTQNDLDTLETSMQVPALNSESVDEMIVENNSAMKDSIVVDIDMDNFSFTPNIIEAYPGQEVTVNLTNMEGEHDFILEEWGVHTDHATDVGEELSVTFTIPDDADGEYEFYCGVGNHRELGMVGTILVDP